MEALWALIAKELVWLERHGIRGAAFPDKYRCWQRLDTACQELCARGFQLTMGTVSPEDMEASIKRRLGYADS